MCLVNMGFTLEPPAGQSVQLVRNTDLKGRLPPKLKFGSRIGYEGRVWEDEWDDSLPEEVKV